jgi:hypothetical protein
MNRSFLLASLVCMIFLGMVLTNLHGWAEPPLETKLDGLDARQALALANQWFQEKQPVKSFINAREIVFEFQDGKVRKIALPAKEMMVAIAPYVQKSHTWGVHYLSSCQGELIETEFVVKAVDPSGITLLNQPVKTLKNGFMELWLPRGKTLEVTITGLNRSATGTIETMDNSKTCVTTMQLR